MAAMTCPNCHRPLAPGAHFCSSCGYTLAPAPPPVAPPQQQVPPAYPQATPPAPQQPAYYQQPPASPYQYPAGAYAYPARPVYSYPIAPGYYQAQQVPRKTGRSPIWMLVAAGVLAMMVVLASVAYAIGPRAASSTCTPSCRKPPPQAPALGAPHVYTSSRYGFQVAYYDHPELGSALKVAVQDDHQIGWTITGSKSGLTYPITISGQDAGSAGPEAIVDAVQQSKYPDAQKVYSIPGVQLGYQNGAGTVYDVSIKSGGGASVHGRLLVAAAIKNGVAITVVTLGPYIKTTPADGHPNPAETPLSQVADDLASNITFKGDQPL